MQFIEDNNINSQYITRYPNHNSSIALAFLDQHKNATYTFYKDFPENRLQGNTPIVKKDEIVLFGSSFALQLDIRNNLIEFLKLSYSNNAIIIYDLNIRKKSGDAVEKIKKMVRENIRFATIIRASDEDIYNLNYTNIEDFYKEIENNKVLIVTRNKSAT
ncbi:MAG: PfkB family carbohydrate kinase, partial [Bacteroidales bacterium]